MTGLSGDLTRRAPYGRILDMTMTQTPASLTEQIRRMWDADRARYGAGFTAGHVYQVTDQRLAVLGDWYARLHLGDHVIAEHLYEDSLVLVAFNTRTGERMWLRGEAWVAAHFRDLGAINTTTEEDPR